MQRCRDAMRLWRTGVVLVEARGVDGVEDVDIVGKIHDALCEGPPPHLRPKATAGRGKIYSGHFIDDGKDERPLSFNTLHHLISERNLPDIDKCRPMNKDEYLIHCLMTYDYVAFARAVDAMGHPPDLTVLDAAVSCGDAFVVQVRVSLKSRSERDSRRVEVRLRGAGTGGGGGGGGGELTRLRLSRAASSWSAQNQDLNGNGR